MKKIENPISTAVLSYGMSGRVFQCPFLHTHPGFSLDVIVKRKDSIPIPIYPEARILNSVDEVINDTSIELVIVNLPNQFHFDLTKQALEAGKHVVVEKPFTVTSQEAAELARIAKEMKLFLMVFQSRRWDGDFMTVKKLVEEKRLGRIVEFELHYDRFRNTVSSNTWKEEPSPGSGNIYNLGSHIIDQAICLFGKPNFVDARMGIQRTGGKADDFFDVRMEYNNMLAILKSSYLVREPGPRYILHGEQGSFVKFGTDPQEQALIAGKMPGGLGWGIEPETSWGKLNTTIENGNYEGTIPTLPGNYMAFFDNVYEGIRNGAEPAVKHEDSVALIKIIEACIESNRSKRAIKID
jgi:scyllo-inositol 2-dehydrogenase (NADP+)